MADMPTRSEWISIAFRFLLMDQVLRDTDTDAAFLATAVDDELDIIRRTTDLLGSHVAADDSSSPSSS